MAIQQCNKIDCKQIAMQRDQEMYGKMRSKQVAKNIEWPKIKAEKRY